LVDNWRTLGRDAQAEDTSSQDACGFFDSSVLVKRYLTEPGSSRARELFFGHRAFSSSL